MPNIILKNNHQAASITATFALNRDLADTTLYTAYTTEIITGAADRTGQVMLIFRPVPNPWTFTTGVTRNEPLTN